MKEAHQAVPVIEADWPRQAARAEPDGDLYLATCGTYGISSAGEWWSRVAAALVKYGHYLLGPHFFIHLLIFADDFDLKVQGSEFAIALLGFVFYLCVFKVPQSWKKYRGGSDYSWIGFQADLKGARIGLSIARAKWVTEWCRKMASESVADTEVFAAGLGRLTFAVAVLEYERPFLAPLHAFAAVWRGVLAAPIPPAVTMALLWVAKRVEARHMMQCARRRVQMEEPFRVDAKAEGDLVVVGGWEPKRGIQGKLDPWASRWFSVHLTPANAPWAFRKGLPFKSIMALELFASLLSVMLFGDEALATSGSASTAATLILGGLTDNEGVTSMLSKGASSRFPLCLVAMELAAQLDMRGATLEASWVPREMNQEADDLTNDLVGAFNPELRIEVDLDQMDFKVLSLFEKAAADFFLEARGALARQAAEAPARPTLPKGRRRERTGALLGAW